MLDTLEVAPAPSVRTPGLSAQSEGANLGMPRADRALLALGRELRDSGYRFTTITPASHRRVTVRTMTGAPSPEDIFGWSRPFRRSDVSESTLERLEEAGELEPAGSLLRSGIRFSTLGDQLFLHSAFPTEQSDAVFFGPDTYRFARMVRQSLTTLKPRNSLRILDVAAGSGAGGLHVAALMADAEPSLLLTDINRRALRFCRINSSLNGIGGVKTLESDLFAAADGLYDLIISNPPYLVDPLARVYRHGRGKLGSELSLNIVEQGIDRLAPGGRLVLYTGSAVVGGTDIFREILCSRLAARDLRLDYEEIDPDVFGEELEHSPYDRVDRIAVVGVTIDVP